MLSICAINAYVEQFHLLFLDQLGRNLDKRHYALRGGCNLRFCLKSIRYSEDMDIDVQHTSVDKLQEYQEQYAVPEVWDEMVIRVVDALKGDPS